MSTVYELRRQIVGDRLDALLADVERWTTEAFGAGDVAEATAFHAAGIHLGFARKILTP